MSDIVETKGPNADYIHAADGVDDNDPDHFDTRLWIQFRPAGDDTFGEGARFLFCGLTNSANTTGEDTVYFGDRTPPTTVLFGRYQDWGGENQFMSGLTHLTAPNRTAHPHTGFEDDGHEFIKYAYFNNWMYYHWAGYFLQFIGVKSGPATFHSYYHYGEGGDWPYFQFGYNTGWSGQGNKFPALTVAKCGLVPMADNDNDGIIDGTGVIVPSTTSSHADKMYGNTHQRISAHCVGLIGGSEREWMRHGGKVASGGWFSWLGGSSAVNLGGLIAGKYADAPENVGMEKCLFICSDMHYGDLEADSTITYTVTASNAINGRNLTEFTLTTADAASKLQAGDCVYIKTISGTTYNTAATIMAVDASNNKITVDILISGAGTHAGEIYPHSPKEGGYVGYFAQNHRTDNHGVSPDTLFHYSYDKDDPTNGEIFTEGDACGHYGRTWFSKPNVPYGTWSLMPGILFNIEKLDYRAGFMMRPFEVTENTFEDLILGTNTAIDITSMPDHVYHVKNSTALHHHVNDTTVDNQFASRMYISSQSNLEGESNKTKIYLCDLNFNFPHVGNHIPLQGTAWGTDRTTDDYNTINAWDILASGTLSGTCYTHVSTDVIPFLGATNNPVVTFTSGLTNCLYGEEIFQHRGGTGLANDDGPFSHRNGFAGLCLSIVDNVTGTMQTRYIVSSHSAGTAETDHAYVGVHFPFGHEPAAGDTWYLSHHSNICTAPIRLLKETTLTHSLGTALKADPTLLSPLYKNSGAITSIDGN